MSHLLESLFIMDGDYIRPVVDGKKIQARHTGGAFISIENDGAAGKICANTTPIVFDTIYSVAEFSYKTENTTMFSQYMSKGSDQITFGLSDEAGNQMILTNIAMLKQDHDVPVATDPLFGIFSDTDPDTDNTQNILFWHDKTDGNCQVNKGEMNFDIYDGFLNIKRRSDGNDILMAGHDGTDGKINTQTGHLKLRAASDVVIKRGTAAINGAMATDEIMFYFDGAAPGDVYLNYYDGTSWETKNLTV